MCRYYDYSHFKDSEHKTKETKESSFDFLFGSDFNLFFFFF